MKFENILADINGFGRFQIMIIVISFIGRFTLPCHFMLNNFIAAVPSHHCDISFLDDEDTFRNLSAADRLVVSIPVQEDGTPNSCWMFAEPQYHLLLNSSNITELHTVQCPNGWVYDNSTFKSTLTSEWDLVCDRRGKNKATATIFFIGVMFGAMTFGSLSDRYGRRIMLLVSYVTGMLFGIASAFSTSYVMFVVLRFFTGFCITGIVIVSAVLSVEWVDVEHRKLVGVIDSLSWTFGNTVFALDPETQTTSLRLSQLTCTYYGISLNVTGFGVDIYLTQFIYGASEVPAKLFIYYTLDRIGRRLNQAGTLFMTGVCILCNMFIPNGMGAVRTAVGALGKTCAEAAFTTVFLYTTELYPTVMRQNGLGYCSFIARFGVSVSPLILVLEEVWGHLPSTIFTLVAFAGGLSASCLPETTNVRLPETIEDVEQTRRRSISPSEENPQLYKDRSAEL